jgi:hypothetical protein
MGLLAIMRTLKHFHNYLYGQDFHLGTDHPALTWLMSFKNLEGQTARWGQRLQEHNFPSEHRQGQNTARPMPFTDDHAEKSVRTATKSRRGQMSTRYEPLQL